MDCQSPPHRRDRLVVARYWRSRSSSARMEPIPPCPSCGADHHIETASPLGGYRSGTKRRGCSAFAARGIDRDHFHLGGRAYVADADHRGSGRPDRAGFPSHQSKTSATDANAVLVRDPSCTPELQEIGILKLLQRYACRGSKARWSPDEAIAFLETKTRWLDADLERWEADGEDIDADSDLIEKKSVVLVVSEQPGQPLRTELLDVLIHVDD